MFPYSDLLRDLPMLLLLILLRLILPLTIVFGIGWLLWRFLAPEQALPRHERFAQFVLQVRELPSARLPQLSAAQILALMFVLLLWIAAMGFLIVRYFWGLGPVTALNDLVPWGLWIGFDVMTGVALAAGGFTLAATVYVFRLEHFRPILRSAILTALIGYSLVIAALLVDLGRYYNIWHPIILWNPHSVMFEVAWCVMLYTTVLLLEFSGAVWERFNIRWAQRLLHAIMVPLVIVGVILSTLHQSSLGSLYLIFATKLHAFWYTPLLPVLFFASALAVGLAMVIVEGTLTARGFGRTLENDLLAALAKASVVVLLIYLVLKMGDLLWRGQGARMLTLGFSSALLWLELIIGLVIPLLIFASASGRENPRRRFRAALMVVFGVLLNRMNVAVFGFYEYTAPFGTIYWPALGEWIITLALATVGVTAYILGVKLLPVLPAPPARTPLPSMEVVARR